MSWIYDGHVELAINMIGTPLALAPGIRYTSTIHENRVEKKYQVPFIYVFRTNSEPIHFVWR